MNEFGSKTCYNCYSAQLPTSRFCDNCGNRFVAEVTVIGNEGLAESKTFIRRQVSETRPLFWASILIAGTLTVFGFAQAGVFSGKIGGSASPPPLASALRIEKDEPAKISPDTTAPVSETKDVTSSNDQLLELNGSVFDMKHESLTASAAPKRRSAASSSQPATTKANLIAKTDQAPEAIQKAIENPPTQPVESAATKTAEPTANTARVYVRGPLGGCYYLTASGGKRYVDRSVCK